LYSKNSAVSHLHVVSELLRSIGCRRGRHWRAAAVPQDRQQLSATGRQLRIRGAEHNHIGIAVGNPACVLELLNAGSKPGACQQVGCIGCKLRAGLAHFAVADFRKQDPRSASNG